MWRNTSDRETPSRIVRRALAVLALVVGAAMSAHVPAAADPGPAPASAVAAAATAAGGATGAVTNVAGVPAADTAARAADPASATPDYLARVRAGFTPRNREYATIRAWLAILAPFYSIAVAALLLFSGFAARVRDFAHARTRSRYLRVLVVVTLVVLAGTVLELPLAGYRGFLLEHQYGLSTQTFGAWLADQAKDAGFGIALYGLTGLAALAYALMERSPRWWWIGFGLATLPVLLAGTFLQPLVFDPLYNRFTRLRDPDLERRIVALAERAGIPARRVFEVDKSRQTVKFNAYVAGFGTSQRIVLWDTMLKGMEDDEILFIVGHEIGHYRLGHIVRGLVLTAAGSFLVYFVVRVLMLVSLARCGRRWGIEHVHDPATLPLFTAALSLTWFALQPVSNAVSRSIERESDVYALEITRDNDAGARSFVKLGMQNRNDPEPGRFVEIMLYTHPPLAERVRRAIAYRPWERGRPNRFYREAK